MAPPTSSPTDVAGPALVDSARGWRNVGAAFVSMFVVFGVAYSFGAFFAPMSEEFGTGSGATSAVFSITAFCYFALGSVSGWAVDRVGPRPVLLVGAAALGIGLLATAQVEALWLGYLSYGLGVGVAVACGYVPMVAVVGGWFERRRGVALGLAVAGIGVGTLAIAPLAALLIERVGWRTTFVVFGVVGAVALVGCALVATKPPEHDGDVPPPLRRLVRTPAFVWLWVSALLLSSALFVPFVFLPAFATDLGVASVAAATLVGLIGMASVVGRLATGVLADYLGRIRTYQACVAIMAASYLVWLTAPSYWALVAFTIVLGVGYGGWVALGPAVVAELFGLRGLGRLVGLTYTAAAVGSLAGPPLAGVIIDATGTYRWAIAVSLALASGAFLVLLPLRRPAAA
ncbi:MAG: MFS transporter [Pseudonocardiaceae bacterium]|nr:MFS transporter [Pseudonocardiaceae bacterium]